MLQLRHIHSISGWPQQRGQCSSLRYPSTVQELAQCTSLTDINAQDNAIQHVPAHFEELKELQRLNLDKNRSEILEFVIKHWLVCLWP